MCTKPILVCVMVFCVAGCGIGNMVSLHELKSANRRCNDQAQYLRRLSTPPHRVTVDLEAGVETWAWDTDVRHERRADKAGAPYWYEGYYMDCTYEVDFDPEGNKIDARWIGAGCFTPDGRLYDEGSFFYDE